MKRITDIKKREEVAPKGAWKTYKNPRMEDSYFVAQDMPIEPYGNGRGGVVRGLSGDYKPVVPHTAWCIGVGMSQAPAEFIAHARKDIPYLLRLVRELEAENKKLNDLRNCYCDLGIPCLPCDELSVYKSNVEAARADR